MDEREREELARLLLEWENADREEGFAETTLYNEVLRLNAGGTTQDAATAHFKLEDVQRTEKRIRDRLKNMVERATRHEAEHPYLPLMKGREGLNRPTRISPSYSSETPSWVPSDSVRIGEDLWLTPDGQKVSSGRTRR